MEKTTTKASMDLVAVHRAVQKKYKQDYAKTITPYIKILRQVMDAQGIPAEQALKNINESTLVQPNRKEDKALQDSEDAQAYEKQRLFVSATMCILEADAEIGKD